MNLQELQRMYKIGFRHNPKHFYGNSFRVEPEENRLVVVGTVKRHVRKRFRIVGVVKEVRK
jgi:hypothetical protein